MHQIGVLSSALIRPPPSRSTPQPREYTPPQSLIGNSRHRRSPLPVEMQHTTPITLKISHCCSARVPSTPTPIRCDSLRSNRDPNIDRPAIIHLHHSQHRDAYSYARTIRHQHRPPDCSSTASSISSEADSLCQDGSGTGSTNGSGGSGGSSGGDWQSSSSGEGEGGRTSLWASAAVSLALRSRAAAEGGGSLAAAEAIPRQAAAAWAILRDLLLSPGTVSSPVQILARLHSCLATVAAIIAAPLFALLPMLCNAAHGAVPAASLAAHGGVLAAFALGIGNFIAQKADESRGLAIDYHRILILVMFGLLIKGPILAAFYHYIEIWGGTNVAKKVGIDLLLGDPMFAILYLVGPPLLAGGSRREAADVVRSELYETLKLNYQIWPPATVFNYLIVPPHLRVSFVLGIDVIYNVALSLRSQKGLNNASDRNPTPVAAKM